MDRDRVTETERIPLPGKHDDLPHVIVGYGGVEAAIRLLHKRMSKAGVLRLLKERRQYPAPCDRARHKGVMAASRRKREQAKRSAWKARA
jgi:ribosomal protein S21